MMVMMMMNSDDELSGRLPSDLTNLDSTELRLWNHETPIDVDSCLASMSSVTMTSHDVTMTSLDDKLANAVRANIHSLRCCLSVYLSLCKQDPKELNVDVLLKMCS